MLDIIVYIILFVVCSIIIGELFSISNKLDRLIKNQTIIIEKLTGQKVENNTENQKNDEIIYF